jgi:hypothetical protein
MSQFEAGTLSPPVYTQILTQGSNALAETPVFVEFLTGLWSKGMVILTLKLKQLRPHQYQRELSDEYVDALKESIQSNNLSYLYPMKASTTYDWEALKGLDPFAPAPSDLIAHVFDGGHRLAALGKIKAHSGPLRCWPVELFPEGEAALNDWATWQHLNNSLKDHLQANIQVFRAYISVLNLAILGRPSSSCEKWAGLVAVLDQYHSRQVYTYQDLAPIHNIVKTLREGSGSSSKKEAWHKIAKMLRHPRLVKKLVRCLAGTSLCGAMEIKSPQGNVNI